VVREVTEGFAGWLRGFTKGLWRWLTVPLNHTVCLDTITQCAWIRSPESIDIDVKYPRLCILKALILAEQKHMGME
jgi:hypothetical protein